MLQMVNMAQKRGRDMASEFRKGLANDIGARGENRLTSRREHG
jgi:hypothetical protein